MNSLCRMKYLLNMTLQKKKVEKENSFQPPLIIAAGETSEAGYTLQRLDRQTRRIGVINNDSIPLIINDIEQVCSASGCGYRGMSGETALPACTIRWAILRY